LATFIPEETITDIKNATSIVDVISESVLLKKQGKNYLGLCPFHSEKTPSFTVSPDKQMFHCFGCSVGGNAFSFLMKQEGLTFPEAARRLAQRAGIEIPVQTMSSKQKQLIGEKEAIYHINRTAMELYQDVLLSRETGGKAAAYLKDRGMDDDMIRRFHLGYAPDGWRFLTDRFSKKGVPLSRAEKAGLIVPQKSGRGYYDRFRDRIIFPILDGNGKPVAFGGRAMGDGMPKYLNSPETPVYSKSRSLYGLVEARARCRETGRVHIVEGYFDFLSLYKSGVQNTVATLGTALTLEHIRILKGYADKFVLVYDSDEAGLKAAHRSVGIFMDTGVAAQILILPSGYDPDDYVTQYGSEGFSHAVKEAMGVIDFLVDRAIRTHGLTVEGKIRIIEDMMEPISSIEDTIARSLYAKKLSEVLEIDEPAIRERLRAYTERKLASNRRRARRNQGGRPNGADKHAGRQIPAGNKGAASENRFERKIISMMLQFPLILPEIESRETIDGFSDEMMKDIGLSILQHLPKLDNDVSALLAYVDDGGKREAIAQMSMGDGPWDYEGCIQLLEQFDASRARRGNRLLRQIKAAEERGDYGLVDQLLKDKQRQAGKYIR